MSRNPKILAFSGSSRKGSYNAKLLAVAVDALRMAGAEVTVVDLRELALPIYDGDHEVDLGIPLGAQNLRGQMIAHDGLLIASPEYNGSVSALLKNALDWCSRPSNGNDGLAPYRGKAVALVAASVGPFGGVRGILALRAIMAKMGAVVLAEDLAVPFAQNAFDANGALNQAIVEQAISTLTANFIKLTNALHVSTSIEGQR